MLLDLLRRTAARAPDLPFVLSPGKRLAYSAAVTEAGRLARGLRAREVDRFGCVLQEPAAIPTLLAAAAAIGAEACVYPAQLRPDDFDRFATKFGHEVVVSDSALELSAARVEPLDELPQGEGDVESSTDAAPVLILTTGTTGDQKGARHDWGRLTETVRPDREPGARWLLAYNLNQFAGLQVLLHVVASGATLVVPRSNQPPDALEAMREHEVTHVSATPTFWRLLSGKLEHDGPGELSLQQITLGGEAAPESLIERLRDLFPDARLRHVYAGTEFGSALSVSDGRAGLPVSVLDRGEDAPVQLRIADGELQIRSRVGMVGYHEAEETADEWRSTGDLVELRDDRIHFVGRTTEVINVGGAKVHPLPVEEAVARVPGVTLVRVYGRPNAVTGQIVALDVVPAEGTDTERLEADIRTACESLPRAARPRRIHFVEELELRGSKLVRSEPVAET